MLLPILLVNNGVHITHRGYCIYRSRLKTFTSSSVSQASQRTGLTQHGGLVNPMAVHSLYVGLLDYFWIILFDYGSRLQAGLVQQRHTYNRI